MMTTESDTTTSNSAIIVQQSNLNRKIDNASAGIANIADILKRGVIYTDGFDPATNNILNTLLSSIPPSIVDNCKPSCSNNFKIQVSSQEMRFICSQVTELFNDLSSFRSQLVSIEDQIQIMKAEHKKVVEDLKTEFKRELDTVKEQHKKDICELKATCNNQRQYSQMNNVMFHNLIVSITGNTDFTQEVANVLNHLLPMLKVPLSVHNINVTHPMRSNRRGEPLIIVRFVNRHIKKDILSLRHVLERYQVGATEHLTQMNASILKQASHIVGRDNAWSEDCSIYARCGNRTVSIVCDEDLKKLRANYRRLHAPNLRPYRNNSMRSTNPRGYSNHSSYRRNIREQHMLYSQVASNH